MDTIFALASGRGKAGVAVIRISGPQAHAAVGRLTVLPEPRRTALRRLMWQGEMLDEALVLLFEAGGSFTGEQSAELQVHGSRAVTAAVLRVLGSMPDLRMAEAGEFTRRALENGRLDLAQVEGLADLIDAETEAQRKQALRVFSGALGAKVERWRKALVRAAALIEASIDFADEDVPASVTDEVAATVERLIGEFQAELRGFDAAERVRDGFEVAIVGAPNVGKSTLLNTLAGREAAITSEIAGTTRDVIEVRMEIAGLPVTILDTAGLRESSDTIEQIGINRALERAGSADLRVFLRSPASEDLIMVPLAGDIVLTAKADLVPGCVAGVSGRTGAGVGDLLEMIADRLSARAAGAGSVIRERHRFALHKAVVGLALAEESLKSDRCIAEIVAVELREAIRALEAMVGRVGVEDLLDEIFASFCIGK